MNRRGWLRAIALSGSAALAGCADAIRGLGGEAECGPGTVSIDEIRSGEAGEGIVDLKGEVTAILETDESTGVSAVRLNDSTGSIRVEFREVEPANPDVGECIAISGRVNATDGDRIVRRGLVE